MSTTSAKSFTRSRIYRLVLDALFIALYVVLSVYLVIKTPIVEISWATLPVLLCAFLYGVGDALAVALLGSFLEQMLTFGLTATTPIWMLPVILQALLVALLAKLIYKATTGKTTIVLSVLLIIASEFFLTALNTGALYLDGYIVGYPVKALVVLLPTRLLNGCVRALLSALLVTALLPPLRKVLAKAQGGAN